MTAAVRPFQPADLPGLDELRILAYPEFPEARDTEFQRYVYEWMETHPLAADHMHRWVVADGDRIVGHLVAMPQYYRIGGRRVVAHTPADYMVLPQYGFHALSIMRRFFRTAENCVACDQVPEPIVVEKRLGAREAGKVHYAAKLLDLSQLTRLPSYVPSRVPRLLTRGMRAVDGALGRAFGGDHEVEVLEGFDASFDRLFEEVADAAPCVPEKDTAFLRWRYGPGSPLYPPTVIGVREGGRLLGYAVLRVTERENNGVVLDLTVLPGRQDVARSLLWGSVRYFTGAGAYIIRYRYVESPTSPLRNDLLRLGFFFRDKRRHTLLTRFADPGLDKQARDIGNWSYSIGDGEASFWVR
jgi:hypothetical protein